MANILDYLRWRGDVDFSASPINAVDSLLFSTISHIDFTGIVPCDTEHCISLGDAADVFFKKNKGQPESLGMIVPDAVFDALDLMSRSVRFKNVGLSFFENNYSLRKQQQFSALTVILPHNQGIYVAFRGTDDTIVGWKEDFNMSFMKIVPSQHEAVKYLEQAARIQNGDDIYVGGHSKGGNLAAFGSAFCSDDVRTRIKKVYCSDAPGFSNEVLDDPLYRDATRKIIRIVPEMSVVGMLLNNSVKEIVVKSTAKGIFQHDPFSWEVLGCDFIYAEGISEDSKIIKSTIDQWLKRSSPEQLSEIVNSLYVFLSLTEATTLTELNNNRSKLLSSMRNMPSETKHSILQLVKLMTNAQGNKIKSGIKRRFTHGGVN